MNRLFRSKKKKAFTLIELLVVIAIIALLAAILAPAVTKALLRGQVTQTMSNGRNLFVLLFSKDLDNPLGLQTASGSAAWPATGEFQDSTQYFATLVTNAAFNLSYNFFAASGVRPASTEQEFLDAQLRNVWCITEDVDGSFKASSPVLFTQNINLNGRNLDQFVRLEERARPFGTRAAVIVGYGGSAFSIDADTALGTNFNPVGTSGTALYPKGTQLID
ncbi:MAG TPA: prepilin-type N-terminal cleavage/methylation domain-containing protein [Kiritimatiellia bacterium]|nr:prepilin-type N-terminal cleavage/methylation domain-containing protein [Kiritimatiellia bacterium]HMO99189.1 prepilin-type N-terminal cleavage/methylation domain-containing protein [Kiritimatiellia bacterium]HMP95776.1 prepilin-type N-terminal cleavage/methylation domain-containing protein [Kiritimatiellia bacterium]